jgi:hypothetical protein
VVALGGLLAGCGSGSASTAAASPAVGPAPSAATSAPRALLGGVRGGVRATATPVASPTQVTGAPTLKGREVATSPRFESAGRVDITRKWDAFNNCVTESGSEYKSLKVENGTLVRLSVTTIGSGSCFYEPSRMHWQIMRLDENGKATGDTADVSLKQAGFPRVLDYAAYCEGHTGNMRCAVSGVLGINVAISF